MSEEHLNEQPEDKPEEKPPVPLTQTLGFGAGTMLAAGMVDLVAHLLISALVSKLLTLSILAGET